MEKVLSIKQRKRNHYIVVRKQEMVSITYNIHHIDLYLNSNKFYCPRSLLFSWRLQVRKHTHFSHNYWEPWGIPPFLASVSPPADWSPPNFYSQFLSSWRTSERFPILIAPISCSTQWDTHCGFKGEEMGGCLAMCLINNTIQ